MEKPKGPASQYAMFWMLEPVPYPSKHQVGHCMVEEEVRMSHQEHHKGDLTEGEQQHSQIVSYCARTSS